MRKITVHIAIFTILTLLLSSVPTFAKGDNDIQGEYDLLRGLGFFETDMSTTQANITGEIFISTLKKAVPKVERYNFDKYSFDDDNKFTTEEACTILLDMLSYTKIWENQGVVKTATDVGLLRNVVVDTSVTFSDFVNMLYNALDVKVLKQTVYGSRNRYDTYSDKTFLTEVLEVKKAVGIVEADGNTKLSVIRRMDQDLVEIGGEKFRVGDSRGNEFLGQRVKYYYSYGKNDSDNILLYLSGNQYNEIVNIEHNNIENFTDGTYFYRDGNKLTKQKTDKTADVIYNGKAVTPPFSKYIPTNGSVVLIDNNKDGYSDVIKITDCYNLIVKSVNKETYEIVDKFDGSKNVILDPYSSQIRYKLVDENGKNVHMSEIREWSILSVTKSLDGDLISMILSNKKVSGILKEKNEDYVFVDGVQYKCSVDIGGIVGDFGTFYFDYSNNIVAFNKEKSGKESSGYLVGMAETGGIAGNLRLKIFDESSKFNIYNTTAKIKVNDVLQSCDNVQKIITANGTKKVDQLIIYKINGKGEIYEIRLAADYSTDLGQKGFKQENPPKTRYAHKMNNFSSAFRQDPLKTKVYLVPEEISEEEQFMFYNSGKDYFKFNTYYVVTAYSDGDALPYVEYVVVHLDSSASSVADFDTNLMMVENVTQSINKNGDETRCLYGLHNSSKVSYILKTTNALNSMKFSSGDIIRIRQNDAKEITAAGKLYDGELGSIVGANPSSEDAMAEYRHLFASVYSAKGDTLFVTTKSVADVKSKADGEYAFADLYKSIYRYDSKQKKIFVASCSELKNYVTNPNNYSKVFVYHHYADPELMVIFD